METIDMLINEIESEILKAKKPPFNSTDVLVNKAVMLDLIGRFRASYPAVVKEATQIKKDRDEILGKAEEYANKTMDAAEERARAMMSETEIVKQATMEAEAMREEAVKSYEKMDYDARFRAFNILESAEAALRDGLSKINERKSQLIQPGK